MYVTADARRLRSQWGEPSDGDVWDTNAYDDGRKTSLES